VHVAQLDGRAAPVARASVGVDGCAQITRRCVGVVGEVDGTRAGGTTHGFGVGDVALEAAWMYPLGDPRTAARVA
jgi:hypothetical protein